MTGKEKLIKWFANADNEALIEAMESSICPDYFEMNNMSDNQLDCVGSACRSCWQQALKKEYPNES